MKNNTKRTKKEVGQPRCKICGRYFSPGRRVQNSWKTCGREKCRKKRKREQEKAWRRRNPESTKNLYNDYIKAWRKKNPDYQRQWRTKRRSEIKTSIQPKPPIKSIRIHLRGLLPKSEIKTQLFKISYTESGVWVDGTVMQGVRDKNADSPVRGNNGTDST